MKKSLMSLAVAGFAILSLTSCGGTTASTAAGPTGTTLIVSGPEGHQRFVMDQLSNLKASDSDFANVTFTYSIIGEGQVAEQNQVAAWDASTAPDVYAMASDLVLPMLQKGAIAQVPATYRPTVTAMSDDAEEVASINNTIYAYPYAGDNGYFLYYNKTAFTGDDADKINTIEGIFEVAAKKSMKFAYNLESGFYNVGALFTFGCDYEVTISSQNVITAVNADFDTVNGQNGVRAIAEIAGNANWENTIASPKASAAGEVLAVIDGAWNYNAYANELSDDLGVAVMPEITVGTGGDAVTGRMGAFLGYKMYGVNPLKGGNDRLALSHKVANYLAGETVQRARFNALDITPTNLTVLAEQAVQAHPLVNVITKQTEYSHSQGVVPSGVWSACNNLYAAIVDNTYGTTDAKSAAAFATAINDAIKTLS